MKFQHIFCTTALSIAVATGSATAVAQNDDQTLDPVDRHGGLEVEISEVDKRKADARDAHDKADKQARDTRKKHDKQMEKDKDASLNRNNVDAMRERAADMEEHPNAGNRAVPGAPHAGKNPDIDPVAGEHDFVE